MIDLYVTGFQTCSFFFSSRRRHTRSLCDWSSDVCSSDLKQKRHTRSLCDWISDVCSSDLDLLESLRYVNIDNIDVIRHSLGGHNVALTSDSQLIESCRAR